jgi:hypothetical protein
MGIRSMEIDKAMKEVDMKVQAEIAKAMKEFDGAIRSGWKSTRR